MSEQINLQGVVSKPWVGSSALFRWLGYALVAVGVSSAMVSFLPIMGALAMVLLPANALFAVVVGALLIALANVTALINEIFHANHTIID